MSGSSSHKPPAHLGQWKNDPAGCVGNSLRPRAEWRHPFTSPAGVLATCLKTECTRVPVGMNWATDPIAQWLGVSQAMSFSCPLAFDAHRGLRHRLQASLLYPCAAGLTEIAMALKRSMQRTPCLAQLTLQRLTGCELELAFHRGGFFTEIA